MIMPDLNQQAPANPQVKVQYNQPINNQPVGMQQQFQQQQYAKPQSYPATGINRITTPTTPTTPNYAGQPPVKKVDFGSKF